MKKLLLTFQLVVLFFVTTHSVFAFDSKYSVHTSGKDIDLKKKNALKWYTDNINNNKFYWYDPQKHVQWLKSRALRWHEDNVISNKFYFVHPEHELSFTKKKALKWYERNSK